MIISAAKQTRSSPHTSLELIAGSFLARTLAPGPELDAAFRLRYRSFQVEMAGAPDLPKIDCDEYDLVADQLGVFDMASGKLVATARLICSRHSPIFYSQHEFSCAPLLDGRSALEVGRVCIDPAFRRGIVVLVLWRAIARYCERVGAEVLFGCGSVPSTDARAAAILYRYLRSEGRIREIPGVAPQPNFFSPELADELARAPDALANPEIEEANALLPPLCQAYFHLGCFVPSLPAFDREFRCFDFLTVLALDQLEERARKKFLK